MALGGGSSGGAGSTAGAAINTSAQTIAQMRTDMAAIESSGQSFATSMRQVSSSGNMGGGAPSARNTGGGVGSGRSMGMSLGEITGAGFAKGLGSLFVGGINDFRVGAEDALDYEYARHMARMGTGDYTRFNDNMNAAMNSFNVQDRAMFQTHMATSLGQGARAMFGGGTVGERMAAMNVGAMQSLATIGGMTPEQAMTAEASIYGAPAYFSAMASGVMTHDPTTGNRLGVESIAAQHFRAAGLQGKTLDQFQRAYGMEGVGRHDLVTKYGAEGAQEIITAMQIQLEGGGAPLAPGTVGERAKTAGQAGQEIRGGEYTKGMDTTADTNRSQQEVIQKFADDTINGIVTANGHLQAIYDWMSSSSGSLEEALNAINTAGGYLDTWAKRAPSASGAVTGIISGMLGGIGGGIAGMLVGRGMGGNGGGGGGNGNGCCCCDDDGGGGGDLDLPGKRPGRGGRSPGGRNLPRLPPGAGRAGLIGTGLIAGGYSIYDTIDNTVGAAQGEQRNENIDKGDFATTVGTRTAGFAAGGAVLGSIIPGAGTLAGGGIGALVGLIAGTVEATIRESKDNDQIESRFSEGSWFIEKDQNAKLHYGEMVVPNRIADAVRTELRGGSIGSVHGVNGGRATNVTINLTVQKASDNEALLFTQKVKKLLEQEDELVTVGSGNLGRSA